MPLLNSLLIPITVGRLALLAPNVLCNAALGPWVLPPALPPPSRALTWRPGSTGISFAPGKPKTRSPTNSFLKARRAQEQKNDPRGHLSRNLLEPRPYIVRRATSGVRSSGMPLPPPPPPCGRPRLPGPSGGSVTAEDAEAGPAPPLSRAPCGSPQPEEGRVRTHVQAVASRLGHGGEGTPPGQVSPAGEGRGLRLRRAGGGSDASSQDGRPATQVC